MNKLKKIKQLGLVGLIGCAIWLAACTGKSETNKNELAADWRTEFKKKLPLLGHRNWILVVDKAFPLQQSAGMEYIYAPEGMEVVLREVISGIKASDHVAPIVYRDSELEYIKPLVGAKADQLIKATQVILKGTAVNTMLHDSVFKQLDREAGLFKVLVIKTNETVPYSSTFIRLDCGYWDAAKEAELRKQMAK
ncbi:hypothetical protein G7074_13705 [Pedobacter sp. HDW13]|uniref:hypothetical protein n=1 Tax=Pedobacter sp. HDW13 TaxID=2714940 RepID=UPI001407B3CE|nr:hypothetical protein [Pedobacter sp. HDW13]QIL40222.1 hypothetical protein G7074_13705 [Pedobacter sp. HDW13]